jgi:hypothetical protein
MIKPLYQRGVGSCPRGYEHRSNVNLERQGADATPTIVTVALNF